MKLIHRYIGINGLYLQKVGFTAAKVLQKIVNGMDDIINYRGLSRRVANNDYSIKKGLKPKAYRKQIELLETLIRFWEQECSVS